MNRPLRRVALACLVLFVAMLLRANYVQVVKAEDYRTNADNRRVLLQTYDRERGSIAVGNGASRVAVATSVATDSDLTYLRRYAAGPTYASVTGFYSFVYGATGVERTQDPVLSGEDDRLFVRRFSDQITGREPQGGSIVLTLQPKAQQAAFAAMRGKRGAVVALDPRTGALLASVSLPSYDPNLLSGDDAGSIMKAYRTFSEDAAQPLLNRAVSRTYPPGSTFKVITAAAALEQGRTPQTRLASPTQLTLPQTDRPLRNFGGGTCGDGRTTTLSDALRTSCNTAFAKLGLDLGEDVLARKAAAFGFGSDDLEAPARVATSRFPESMTPPQVAQSAIGQFDVQVTPLQMAMVAAGIANDGKVMRPYVVSEVQAPDLSRLDLAEPEVYREAVSGTVADQLTAMMELVVQRGSATSAQIDGVRVAGKTGTAQHALGKAPHAWFIGFAPAQDPVVAIAVLVEEGGDAGSEATGGRVAAPIAREVIRAVLGR